MKASLTLESCFAEALATGGQVLIALTDLTWLNATVTQVQMPAPTAAFASFTAHRYASPAFRQ